MPVSYQFISKKTGKPMQLIEVEDLMCADMGVPPDEKRYLFQGDVAYTGVMMLLEYGGVEVTDEMLDDLIKSDNMTVEWATLLRKYLVTDYTFRAWR